MADSGKKRDGSANGAEKKASPTPKPPSSSTSGSSFVRPLPSLLLGTRVLRPACVHRLFALLISRVQRSVCFVVRRRSLFVICHRSLFLQFCCIISSVAVSISRLTLSHIN
ncbi:Os02g0532300 [Oryza sativa Japonica Group]|uniref:Uncharacterized protein n=2 Tax=Oryza sativa subsp. japonica TaxID=39947 RepID=A0A0P0VJW9_ORYSJ|nr:unknown protein [Oryza sativa Japonica Group]BAS79040.1 Os02g0532300 [Oryza sativa Japonica Group]